MIAAATSVGGWVGTNEGKQHDQYGVAAEGCSHLSRWDAPSLSSLWQTRFASDSPQRSSVTSTGAPCTQGTSSGASWPSCKLASCLRGVPRHHPVRLPCSCVPNGNRLGKWRGSWREGSARLVLRAASGGGGDERAERGVDKGLPLWTQKTKVHYSGWACQ